MRRRGPVQEPPAGLVRLLAYEQRVKKLCAPRRGALLRAVLSRLRGVLS